jgi:hypothetical protein
VHDPAVAGGTIGVASAPAQRMPFVTIRLKVECDGE